MTTGQACFVHIEGLRGSEHALARAHRVLEGGTRERHSIEESVARWIVKRADLMPADEDRVALLALADGVREGRHNG